MVVEPPTTMTEAQIKALMLKLAADIAQGSFNILELIESPKPIPFTQIDAIDFQHSISKAIVYLQVIQAKIVDIPLVNGADVAEIKWPINSWAKFSKN
jgi:hypothetical protein